MLKRKMIITIMLMFLSLIISGCVGGGMPLGYYTDECFYKIVNNKLVENSVAFGIGNVQKRATNFFPTHESMHRMLLKDITIEVFVDDVLVEIVSLPKEEFYTEEYDINPGVSSNSKEYYKKVIEFNVANYDVKEKIEFVLTIVEIGEEDFDFYSVNEPTPSGRTLELHGNIVDGIFVVDYYREKTHL